MKKSRVFIVDSHELVRLGMQKVIECDARLEFCGDSENPETALQAIIESHADLCITDIKFSNGNGLEFVEAIRQKAPLCRIIVSSMRDELVFAEKSIQAGANGFVSKSAPVSHLMDAIQRVLDGEIVLDGSVQTMLFRNFRQTPIEPTESMQIAGLSRREFEVFEMIGQGQGSQEIAVHLAISSKTVEAHRQNIRNKLGLRNMAELICRAAVWVDKY